MNEKLRSFASDWYSLLPSHDKKHPTWFRKTFQRPQRSRHTRTKRGCK
ncbi:MAG: hypothetical protein RR603_01925 [Kurthia sp.]